MPMKGANLGAASESSMVGGRGRMAGIYFLRETGDAVAGCKDAEYQDGLGRAG